MPPSFEDKVEALRRLKEKRQAKQEGQKQQQAGGYPQPDGSKDQSSQGAAVENTRSDPAGPGGVGEADALFCAGHCLERGLQGVQVNLQSASEMYRLAGEQGHVVAQWRLGELLERGLGGLVEADEKEAARWYTKAAEAGNAQAQSALALLLEDGKGAVEQDLVAAHKWHRSAAEQGHALSQYCLACMLADEDAPNAEEAEKWLRRSAAQNFEPAVAALEDATHCSADKSANAGLLDLAHRIAEQLGGLEDEEADCVLETLLADVPSIFASGAADLPASDDELPASEDEFSDGNFSDELCEKIQ
mmetsp:Transcript_16072/g.28125  ORF Transcript_16072/g.28125 Transcript_16072/m.28125 type:complete len:304 (-) Transcript_16072:143-1054(-)